MVTAAWNREAPEYLCRTCQRRRTTVPQCQRVRARKRPDLQFFASDNKPKLTNWCMLLGTPPPPRLWIYMQTSHTSSNVPTTLPPLVAAIVEATNSNDLERLPTTFADDALVNDQLRDYRGKAAIRRWAERDIIGAGLTIAVTKVAQHYDNFIVTANIDGNFDKRGLPDPLALAFYFTPHTDLIIQLIILRNRQDI
jgi:hypothetical protein